jgi:tetratricopeptide (TPR) repeat protein
VIKDPSLRRRYYKLAGLYHRDLGRLPTAISELRKCLEADPEDAEATFELAALLRHDHQNERAAGALAAPDGALP